MFSNIRGWIQQSSMEHIHHRTYSISFAASFIPDAIDIGSSLDSHLLFYAKTSQSITSDDFVGS